MKQEIEQKELGMGNFQGYPSLLKQIKHRVSFAQQKAMYAANEDRSASLQDQRQNKSRICTS